MSPKSRNKWYVGMALAACVAMCVLGVALFFGLHTPKSEQKSLTEVEFEFYSNLDRAQVSAYFSQTYGVEIGSNKELWRMEYGGETPNRMLEKLAEERMRYDDALRALAKRYGRAPFPTIEELNENLADVNRERAEDIKNGEVVYGPEEYGLWEYYSTLQGTAETELIEVILNDAMDNHRDLLQSRFDQTKTEDLTARRMATLAAYSIEPEEVQMRPGETRDVLGRVAEALEADGGVSSEELEQLAGFYISRREIFIDSSTMSREDDYSMFLLAQAAEVGTGACFEGFDSPDSTYHCVYQVLEQNAGERPTFEDALMTVAARYANEEFDSEIAALVSQASTP